MTTMNTIHSYYLDTKEEFDPMPYFFIVIYIFSFMLEYAAWCVVLFGYFVVWRFWTFSNQKKGILFEGDVESFVEKIGR